MDWTVGCIANVELPEHKAGFRWFVFPTIWPRVPIEYTATQAEAWVIVKRLRQERDMQ